MKKEAIITLCRVYKGEKTNPVSTDEEFKRYIWRMEKAIIDRSSEPKVISEYHLSDDDSYEEYFKQEIKAAIDLYADSPYGGHPEPWYKKYFSL